MKFLFEILGMPNYCNLRCAYCDWDFQRYYSRPLAFTDLGALRRNVHHLRQLMEASFPELVIVEYSGGEIFLYPEVIQEIQQVFGDKWIRLNTNGLLVQSHHLDQIAMHGRTFVALSLDGPDDQANFARFRGRSERLHSVMSLVDLIVARRIPLMILCTLHTGNVEHFPTFVSLLEEKYPKAIAEGLLVLPAHSVSEFGQPKGRPSKGTCQTLIDFVRNDGHAHPLLSPIIEHYEHLAHFMHYHQRLRPCSVFSWVLSTHFYHNQIVADGQFRSFGCGMRGEIPLGQFNISDPASVAQFVQSIADPQLKRLLTSPGTITYQCREGCFVDWQVFDMILCGEIPIARAADWFVVFRDQEVQSFVKRSLDSAVTSRVEQA